MNTEKRDDIHSLIPYYLNTEMITVSFNLINKFIKQQSFSKGESRLREAAAVNNTEKIERILTTFEVNPNAADVQGRTALHFAASRGFVDAVTCLIKAGANVNAEDKLGNTPMHLAVYTGCSKTVCALLRGGAHLDRTKSLKYTPLELAESKYTMLKNHKSVFCHREDTLEIVKILRYWSKEASTKKLQELDDLAAKVSQMGFEEPDADLDFEQTSN